MLASIVSRMAAEIGPDYVEITVECPHGEMNTVGVRKITKPDRTKPREIQKSVLEAMAFITILLMEHEKMNGCGCAKESMGAEANKTFVTSPEGQAKIRELFRQRGPTPN